MPITPVRRRAILLARAVDAYLQTHSRDPFHLSKSELAEREEYVSLQSELLQELSKLASDPSASVPDAPAYAPAVEEAEEVEEVEEEVPDPDRPDIPEAKVIRKVVRSRKR